MNEVSNFVEQPYEACFAGNSTDKLQCYTMEQLKHNYTFSDAQTRAVNPPYAINNARHSVPLGTGTMSPAAQRLDGALQYNAHQLYSLSQVAATYDALRHITAGRPFILTRSSFLGWWWSNNCERQLLIHAS